MAKKLTDKQRAALGVVRGLIRRRGFPPTQSELAAEMGLSVAAVRSHLAALERKGCITVIPRTARGITVRRAS